MELLLSRNAWQWRDLGSDADGAKFRDYAVGFSGASLVAKLCVLTRHNLLAKTCVC